MSEPLVEELLTCFHPAGFSFPRVLHLICLTMLLWLGVSFNSSLTTHKIPLETDSVFPLLPVKLIFSLTRAKFPGTKLISADLWYNGKTYSTVRHIPKYSIQSLIKLRKFDSTDTNEILLNLSASNRMELCLVDPPQHWQCDGSTRWLAQRYGYLKQH